MTYFLDFRANDVGGPVVGPYLYEGDGTAANLNLTLVPYQQIAQVVAGRDLLLATHGFNVSRRHGACSLGLLDQYLNLGPAGLVIAMLWPGDSWLPIVDYPIEGNVAVDCGTRLADFCNQYCLGANSISFFSHSLGARFVLEAIMHLVPDVRVVCLTAGAINRDCLVAEYARAAGKCRQIAVLASHRDDVLKVAFTVGDPLANLLHPDHTPFQAALGYDGPPPLNPQPVARPWQIPDVLDFTHDSYLPPNQPGVPPAPGGKWQAVADFAKRGFLLQPQVWPA